MEKRKRSGRKSKFVFLLLAAALIAATAFYFKDNITSMIGSITKFLGGAADEISYSGYADKNYAEVDGCLAIVSVRGIQVVDLTGEQTLNDTFDMVSPAVKSNGEYGIAYDIGGKTAKVFTSDKVLYSRDGDTAIISANVNDEGYAVVCAREEGYNGIVTVYNNAGQKILDWYSGEAYVMSACLSGNSEIMAALCVAESGGRVVFIDVASGDEIGRYECEEVLIDMVFSGSSSADVISQSGIYTINEKGELKKTYGFEGKYLRGYCLGTSGLHAVVLSSYSIGDDCTAITVKNGKEVGMAEGISSVMKISISGSKFAVLTTSGVKIYSKYGNEKKSFEDLGEVQDILMMKNGHLIAAKVNYASVLK